MRPGDGFLSHLTSCATHPLRSQLSTPMSEEMDQHGRYLMNIWIWSILFGQFWTIANSHDD